MEYQNENFDGEREFRSRIHREWIMHDNLHEYSELLYCMEGEGEVVVNGQRMRLSAGKMVWIPPNYVHSYRFINASVICAVFSNDFIPLFFKETQGRFFKVAPVDPGEYSTLIEAMPELQCGNDFVISGYLNLLMDKVFRQSDFGSESQLDGILYQKVISYVQEHYSENITLRQVAKRFGYNEKYLSHTLHALTGIHFRKLLAYYRIRRAKEIFESGANMTIAAVAEESGFGAINSFNRVFREMTGMTASEYRLRFLP